MSATATQNVFAKALEKICSSSGGLLCQILKILEPIRKIMQDLEVAGRGIPLDVNPTVAMAIEDLKVLFHAVVGKARLYVHSCKDIAYYVCKSGVLKTIRDDLKKQKSTKELTYFFEDINNYLKSCKSCLEQFNVIHTKFQDERTQCNDQWDGEAKRMEEKEKSSLVASGKYGLFGATLGTGSVALGAAASILCPPVAIALAAGACVGTVGAVACFGLAGAFAIERGISDEKKKVFLNAAEKIVELYKKLTTVRDTIQDMMDNIELLQTPIDGFGGLNEMVEGALSGGRLNIVNINAKLDQLEEKMEKTLKEAQDYLN